MTGTHQHVHPDGFLSPITLLGRPLHLLKNAQVGQRIWTEGQRLLQPVIRGVVERFGCPTGHLARTPPLGVFRDTRDVYQKWVVVSELWGVLYITLTFSPNATFSALAHSASLQKAFTYINKGPIAHNSRVGTQAWILELFQIFPTNLWDEKAVRTHPDSFYTFTGFTEWLPLTTTRSCPYEDASKLI